MTDYALAADTIKNTISALDVADTLEWEVRRGRCKCPIHHGGDYNCVLYHGSRGFYCHTCKAGGDVIHLVQSVLFAEENHKNGFIHSIAWFDSTFHMGLELGRRIDPKKEEAAKKALQRRKNAIEFQAWKTRMEFDLAITAGRIVDRLEEVRDERRPRRYGEEWDPGFCAAVVTLPEARKFEEYCMMECTKGHG